MVLSSLTSERTKQPPEAPSPARRVPRMKISVAPSTERTQVLVAVPQVLSVSLSRPRSWTPNLSHAMSASPSATAGPAMHRAYAKLSGLSTQRMPFGSSIKTAHSLQWLHPFTYPTLPAAFFGRSGS
jgi:hypothetical protein